MIKFCFKQKLQKNFMRKVLILLLIVTLSFQSQCDDYIQSIIQAISTQQAPPISQQTFMDSGSVILCDNEPEYRYIRLKAVSVLGECNVGLCLPSYCTQEDLKPYEEQTKAAINLIMQSEVVSQVNYSDPDLVYPSMDAGTYFCLLLVGVIFSLNILGSFVSGYMNSKKDQFMQEQLDIQKDLMKNQKPVVNEVPSPDQQSPDENEQQVIAKQTYGYMSDEGSVDQERKGQVQVTQDFQYPMWAQVLLCFSFTNNLEKLFKVNKRSEQQSDYFEIFNGMRVLSMFWVVYGHDYMVRLRLISNIADLQDIIEKPGWITLAPAAFFAVDIFFFIGGFLAAFVGIDKLSKIHNLKLTIVPSMWLHRFLRIWPTYAFILLVYYKVSIYMGAGPIWGNYVDMAGMCSGEWWKNLLFIDNFFEHSMNGLNYCFGWGWYLANDFQIFLITPFLLILYVKHPKVGLTLLIAIFLASVTTAYIQAWVNDYHVNMPSTHNSTPEPDYQDNFYYKPWIRISPYIMGILYAILYREWKSKKSDFLNRVAVQIQTSILIRTIMYVFGIGLTQFIIWVVVPLQKDMKAWSDQEQYWFQALNRVIFVLGVMFCITPALLGVKNDPSNRILGHQIWVPLARVSFCMYLTHVMVLMFTTYASTQINYFQSSHFLFFVVVDIFFSIISGGILSLLVEAPCMNLEKILFRKKSSRKSHVQAIEE